MVPVLLCDKRIDVEDKAYGEKVISDTDKAAWESYDAEVYDGAWVSVQVVGRRLEEEKVLVLAEYLGELIKQEAEGKESGRGLA